MKHVIVIGLDGMSWNVLAELFRRGVMSSVNSFRKEGVYGDLKSIIPPFTVPTWTSLSTGVNPGKHGAYSFLMPKKDYGSRLVSSKEVKCPRMHEVLSMKGLKSVVINLPLSYPPVALKGVMISDWLYPKCEVFPNSARSLTKDYAPLDPLWAQRDPLNYVEKMRLNLESRLGVIERLFLKKSWSLFFVVFSETDFLLHKLYDDIMLGTGLAKEAYKVFDMIDNFIGKIMRNVPRNSLILLVSDHGFTKYRYVVHTNKILRDAGLSKPRIVDRGTRSSKKISTRKRNFFIPKIFYKAATEVEPARRVLSLLFYAMLGRDVTLPYCAIADPRSSHALMYFTDHFGIYINSKDVFRNWLMKSEEAKIVQNSVKNLLFNVKNPNTGDAVFERICTREELFQGPHAKKFPHIILFPEKEHWIDNGIIGKTVEEKFRINHSLTGIFTACGEEVKRGVELSCISIFDIAPTILHCIGLPVPHDTDGKVLLDIFKEGSEVRRRPIKEENYLERWKIIRKAKLLTMKRPE